MDNKIYPINLEYHLNLQFVCYPIFLFEPISPKLSTRSNQLRKTPKVVSSIRIVNKRIWPSNWHSLVRVSFYIVWCMDGWSPSYKLGWDYDETFAWRAMQMERFAHIHDVDVERDTVTYSASLHLLACLVLVITRRRIDYVDSNTSIRLYNTWLCTIRYNPLYPSYSNTCIFLSGVLS